MDRLQSAIGTLHQIDTEGNGRVERSSVHPAARLLVCIGFLAITVSFHRYDLTGLLSMCLYLLITAGWEDISLWRGAARMRYLFAAMGLLGLANVFYDRNVILTLGRVALTGGIVSMLTLWLKGIFTVCGAYLLILTIGVNGLCIALRSLGLPSGMVTVLLLIWRYLILLLKEVQRMGQAYSLRAPGHKGIHVRAWGSFAGMLLLRSMSRAEEVYQSMTLRGYDGTFRYEMKRQPWKKGISICYAAIWLAGLLFLRWVPVFEWIGGLLTSL